MTKREESILISGLCWIAAIALMAGILISHRMGWIH